MPSVRNALNGLAQLRIFSPLSNGSTPTPSTHAHEPTSPEEPSAHNESFISNYLPMQVTVLPPAEEVFRTTPYRYLIIGLFAAFGFINQLQYVAFSMIVREAQEYFNVNSFLVNLLILLIPIVYVIGVVPGCFVYNKVGLRYGMIIGAGTNAFASILKFIAVWSPDYPLLVVAQVFVALGQILYLSLPTLIAGIWFAPNERTVATAVASLLGFAGMAVGMFYSPHVVSLPDDNTWREWAGLMGSQFGVSMVVFLLIAIFARDKPTYRPSHTSTEDYKLPLAKFLKSQLKDWNFLLLSVAFGLIVGFLTALAGVLVQVLQPYGIDEETSGILAFSGILGGAVNCGAVGLFVDRTHYYKNTAIALSSAATALLIATTVCVQVVTDKDALVILIYVFVPLLEFLVLPIVPVVMELGVELAYPCPETVSSTLVLASMCFFSFVGMIVFSVVLGDYPTTDTAFYCVLITLIVSALSIVGFAFVKEKLRRRAEDDETVLDAGEEENEGDNAEEEEERAETSSEEPRGKKNTCPSIQTGVPSSPGPDPV